MQPPPLQQEDLENQLMAPQILQQLNHSQWDTLYRFSLLTLPHNPPPLAPF